MNKSKIAFTLAETMIVLVILGVVAAITIPALVNRHMEAERRTKYRKAMSVYDTALNKMVIENGIKSDTALTNWADSNTKNDCANTSAYFKVSRNLEVNGNITNCKFRAPDGVFWDISDIKKPLIALREQDLNDETAQSDTNRAFYMFGWFDEQGSLRANDMGKVSTSNQADLAKLYDFLNGKAKATDEEEINSSFNSQIQEARSKYSTRCSGVYKSCYFTSSTTGHDIKGDFTFRGTTYYYKDENGNTIYKVEELINNSTNEKYTRITPNYIQRDGISLSFLCDKDYGNCQYSTYYNYKEKLHYYCDLQGENCTVE